MSINRRFSRARSALRSVLFVVAISLGASGLALDLTDYLWLKSSDISQATSSYKRENWTNELGEVSSVTSTGKYYIPAGMTVHTPGASTFGGAQLAISGTLYLNASGGSAHYVPEATLLPDGMVDFPSQMKFYPTILNIDDATSDEHPAVIRTFQLKGWGNAQTFTFGYSGCSLKGDSNAVLVYGCTAANERTYDEVRSGTTTALVINLDDYYGKLIIPSGTFFNYGPAVNAGFPGTLEVQDRAILSTSMTDGTFTLGGMKLDDGAEVDFFYYVAKEKMIYYTITNSFEAVGKFRIGFRYWGDYGLLMNDKTYAGLKLFHFAKAAVTEGLPDLRNAEIVGLDTGVLGPVADTAFLDYVHNDDDSADMVLKFDFDKLMIKNNSSNGSRAPMAFEPDYGGAECWYDGEIPAENYEGLAVVANGMTSASGLALDMPQWSTKSFPNMTLVIPGQPSYAGTLYAQFYKFTCKELHICGPSSIMAYSGSNLEVNFYGKVYFDAVENSTSLLSGGNGKVFYFRDGIAGDGDVKLGYTWPSTIGARLFGENADYYGAIWVYSTAAQYDPDNGIDNCATLYFEKGAKLGGAFAGKNASAWQSLRVSDWSKLVALGDVQLNEPTRGIFVDGNARFSAPAAATLEIAQPLTLGGTLTKIGAGNLKLGGALQFVESASGTPSATPNAGVNNLIAVNEGSLSAGATNSLVNAQVSFAAGTSLVVDLSATGDLAEYGAMFTGDGAALAYADEKLAVTLANTDGISRDQFSKAICTVSSARAETLELSVPAALGRRAITFARRANADGTVTMMLTVAARPGLRLIFR